MSAVVDVSATKPVLPLNFPASTSSRPQTPGVNGPTGPVLCLFCADAFEFPDQKDEYLAHLYVRHHLIISEVDTVAILAEYLVFWRAKFEAVHFDPKEYCTTMLLNHLPDRTPAPPTEYFLLDDNLPLDRQQRIRLHQRRLETVLTRHQLERTDCTYQRTCLFCRETCQPSRAAFIGHLFRKHYLHLGRPDNLVYIDELIDDVRDKLARLVCLFCAKTFKDRPTLKEHMRKKGHKRINPDDKQYDKYYMVNYTRELPAPSSTAEADTLDRAASQAQAIADAEEESRVFQTPDGSDSDWSDWEEAPDGADSAPMRCLFCAHTERRYATLVGHMRATHAVDLDERLSGLTFHKRMKLVNYVRHQMNELACVTCEARFGDAAELVGHLSEAQHYGLGEQTQWDKAMFLFPLFEDDPLLFCLDDAPSVLSDGASSTSEGTGSAGRSACASPVNMADGVQIYAEDFRVEVNVDAEALSRELMVKL